jgi:hypothetical protein
MNSNQTLADSRIFNFTEESLQRGLAMPNEEKIAWVEEMMILGWEVQARLAQAQEAKKPEILGDKS